MAGLLALGLLSPGRPARAEQFTVAVLPDTLNYCDTADPATSRQPENRPVAGGVNWNGRFGPSSPLFAGQAWYGGAFSNGPGSYQTFAAVGKTLPHLNLELEPSDAALAWAAGMLAAHPGVPKIVTTHELLSWLNDGTGRALYLDAVWGLRGSLNKGPGCGWRGAAGYRGSGNRSIPKG